MSASGTRTRRSVMSGSISRMLSCESRKSHEAVPQLACPGVSIVNFVIPTRVTWVNLSQYGPIPRWKRPAHVLHAAAGRVDEHLAARVDDLELLLAVQHQHLAHGRGHQRQPLGLDLAAAVASQYFVTRTDATYVKSQSKRPPNWTQRPPHLVAAVHQPIVWEVVRQPEVPADLQDGVVRGHKLELHLGGVDFPTPRPPHGILAPAPGRAAATCRACRGGYPRPLRLNIS
jgi:hypothetical protein